jgi:hypothetical protein
MLCDAGRIWPGLITNATHAKPAPRLNLLIETVSRESHEFGALHGRDRRRIAGEMNSGGGFREELRELGVLISRADL